jgi:DNA-binding transcriptional LysR family regulator
MHSLDWNDLRYFLAVCRAGSLAGAARALHVRHSTVSRRLEALEQAIGVSLFVRTPDGLVATEAGAGIRPLAEEVERSTAAIERQAGGSDRRIGGVVRLTTSEAFSGFLVRHLAVLHERHPGLMVEVLAGNRFFDLTRGEADLALRNGVTTQPPDLVHKRLAAAGWSVYAAERYLARHGRPASLDDLSGHFVVGFDETMAQVPGALWLSEHAGNADVVLRGNSIVAALNAAIVGMGIAVLPCFLAEAEPNLRRLSDAVIDSREIWLVFHPDVAKIARVRTVIDFITEVIGREAAMLGGETMPAGG